MARHEGDALPEWIAHHLRLGINRVHILDDSEPGDQQPVRSGVSDEDLASGRVVLHNTSLPRERRFFLGVKALSVPPVGVPGPVGDAENMIFFSRQMMAYHEQWWRLATGTSGAPPPPPAAHLWVGLLDADEFLNPQGACVSLGRRTGRAGTSVAPPSALARARPTCGASPT